MNGFMIETPRLLIRAWQDDDRPALERMVADSEMMRFLTSGRAWRADEVDELLERQARHMANHGFCMGPMVLRATGEVIGVAGLQPLDLPGEVELGWWVWKDHWGKGYATEAGAALVEYGFSVRGLPRLHAVIDPENIASIRVAERLGLRYAGRKSARETVARREDIEIAFYTIDTAAT